MGRGPGRSIKADGPPHGPGGTAHIEPTSHGPRPMRCGLYMGCSARPMRRPIRFDGPARTSAHEMWCIIATINISTTTSTVPMRSPTCFDGPARAVAYEM